MKIFAFFLTYLLLPISSYCQGLIPYNKKKELTAALCFMPSPTLTQEITGIPSTFNEKTDPLISHKYSHSDKHGTVNIGINEAVMYMQWWIQTGEPVERYQFKWISADWFSVSYKDGSPYGKTRTISKNTLSKYPDLLKAYENIAPLNVDVEIHYTIGETPYQVSEDFKRKYNLFGTFGSNGYIANFKRYVSGSGWLFERSNKDVPFMVPGSPSWAEFTGTKQDVVTKRLIELMSMSTAVRITHFNIVSIKWPIDAYVYIAKQLDRYEEMEKAKSPSDSAISIPLPKPASITNAFWDKADVSSGCKECVVDMVGGNFVLRDKNTKKEVKRFPGEKYNNFWKIGNYFACWPPKPYSSSDVTPKNDIQMIDKRGNFISIKGYNKFYDATKLENDQIEVTVDMQFIDKKDLRRTLYHSSPYKKAQTLSEAYQYIDKINDRAIAEHAKRDPNSSFYYSSKTESLTIYKAIILLTDKDLNVIKESQVYIVK